MSFSDLSPVERSIIDPILGAAFGRGLFVSVHDGEEVSAGASRDPATVRAAIAVSDRTELAFFDPAGRRPGDPGNPGRVIGAVLLIHGNGCDVIADYSDNPATAAVLAPALAVAQYWASV